jgi:hypothetical protein
MKSHFIISSVAALALVAALSLFSVHAAPQDRATASKAICCSTNDELQKFYLQLPEAKKPTPSAPDGHPDLSGFYDNPFPNNSTTDANGTVEFRFLGKLDPKAPHYNWPQPTEPSYNPEYMAKVMAIFNSQYGASTPDDPQYDCKPMGVPRASMLPLQIVQTPKLIVILYESNFIGQTYRIIYTDGRPHPKDLDTSFLGDSIGHWEGDTLVVDVIGLNDETWLGGAQGHTEAGGPGEGGGHQIVEKYALIHSDQEHVIERYTRHGDMIVYEATVEDPVMFTKPWVLTPRHFVLNGSNSRLYESFCESRDRSHIVKPSEADQPKCELGHSVGCDRKDTGFGAP